MAKYRFTVFTPVFNRKHTIHRVWDSLNKQTFRDFEWLIVDDGSQDGIKPLLERYKFEADFPVHIHYQENSGKHIAFNKAIDEAQGTLMITADSDDGFVPVALETFDTYWKDYEEENVSGISVLCMDEDDVVIGDKYPFEGLSNYVDMRYKHEIKGEKWGAVRTDLLRKYKFPNIPGGYLPEGYIWEQIGLKYQTVYLNIPLRNYYLDAGNQITRISNNSLSDKALMVKCFYYTWWINEIYPQISNLLSFKKSIKRFMLVWKFNMLAKKNPISVVGKIEKFSHKLFASFLFLPSYVLFRVLKWK